MDSLLACVSGSTSAFTPSGMICVSALVTAGVATSAHATVAMLSRRVNTARIPIFFSFIVHLPLSLCFRDGRDIEALEPFRSIEDRLAQNATFFKCHRSYQVNLRNIDHFNRTEIVMRSGACLPLARSCKQGFQDAYFAVRFEGGRH